jgi:hypothetical protein
MRRGAASLLLGGLVLAARVPAVFGAPAVGAAVCTGSFRPLAPGVWDSNGDAGEGTLLLPLGALGARLELYLAGWPNGRDLTLTLRQRDRPDLKLEVRSPPGDAWSLLAWRVPHTWRGAEAVLTVTDANAGPAQWIGVRVPAGSEGAAGVHWKGLAVVAAAALITLLPFAAAFVALERLCRGDRVLQLASALAVSGLHALVTFFGLFLAHGLGLAWVSLTGAGMVALLVSARTMRIAREVAAAAAAAVSLVVLVAAVTFLYGGADASLYVPAGRHDLVLPMDNELPFYLAERIYEQRPLRPFRGDWLTSDRPPLQSGYRLFSRPWLASPLADLASAMTAQLAVYVGMWALLCALGVPRSASLLCLLGCASSGFFLVNTLYVWPKLLPAGFLLAAAALLARLQKEKRRARPAEIAAIGACLGLAQAGHGASIFGVAGLALLHVVRGGWRDVRLGAVSALMMVTILAPWIAYQNWVDPPGDRLVKYHLAHRYEIDSRDSLTVIREAYGELSWRGVLWNKARNVSTLVGDFSQLPHAVGAAGREWWKGEPWRAWWILWHAVDTGSFFHALQALGVLVVGLPAAIFAWARARSAAAPSAYCLWLFLATLPAWCLLMFGPDAAINHQGTYLTVAALHLACLLAIAGFRPVWRATVLGLHAAVFVFFWALSPEWDPFAQRLRPTLDGFWCATAIVAAALLLGIVRALAREPDAA